MLVKHMRKQTVFTLLYTTQQHQCQYAAVYTTQQQQSQYAAGQVGAMGTETRSAGLEDDRGVKHIIRSYT